MNIEKLEESVRTLVTNLEEASFIYDLLRAYGQPQASITRLKKGDYNRSQNPGEIVWKKKLAFKHEASSDLHEAIDQLQNDAAITKHQPRFLVVTDYRTLLAVDTKTDDSLETPIADLADHFDFFLPWAGLEKTQLQSENPADVRAAEKMGRLYDLILEDNPPESDTDRHALNIFLSRLLFCFFAEDTDIFESNLFTNSIASHTADDGGDLQPYLQKLFSVLNTEDRFDFPAYLQKFPYVNGGLFAEEHPVPTFNTKSRKIIIECGGLNWKAINPDIFGSMIQAVAHPDQRGGLGMHYTSVINIMKVIDPLFLDDLKDELEQAGKSKKKLSALLDRLYRLRIFDPACGSGNFLIIAYKELCKLEIEIFRRTHGSKAGTQTSFRFESKIQLTQFYGIELDDFAHETAKLSLWLTEHQMNVAFKQVFGTTRPTLPLQDGGYIVRGNATRLDWEEVCPKDEGVEIYILGNPPYKGSRVQSDQQKEDMGHAFKGISSYKDLDFVACWFILAARFLDVHSKAAFVATSSICQGSQVTALWPHILDADIEISFAHPSFHWTNNARGNAGVTCSVIGLRKECGDKAYLFFGGTTFCVDNINAYLIPGKNLFVFRERTPLMPVPEMLSGNYTGHAQPLMMNSQQKDAFLSENENAGKFLKRVLGSKELINGIKRWCLWIHDSEKEEAESIQEIKTRIGLVRKSRESSNDTAANRLAGRPHQFRDVLETKKQSVIVPTVSSERRKYILAAFIGPDTIATNKAMVLYDCEPYIFGLIVSGMHMVWVRAIAGRIRKDISYSSVLCYNTFPFPTITEKKKTQLEQHVFAVLDEREAHPEKTLAELYDPDKMPEGLRKAHHEMDLAVERCYRKKPFTSDEERLEYLFKLYEQMIEAEKKGETNHA